MSEQTRKNVPQRPMGPMGFGGQRVGGPRAMGPMGGGFQMRGEKPRNFKGTMAKFYKIYQ